MYEIVGGAFLSTEVFQFDAGDLAARDEKSAGCEWVCAANYGGATKGAVIAKTHSCSVLRCAPEADEHISVTIAEPAPNGKTSRSKGIIDYRL